MNMYILDVDHEQTKNIFQSDKVIDNLAPERMYPS